MIRCLLSLAGFLALGACAERPVEHSDFLGRWTWVGNDCAREFMEFTPDAVYVKGADGEYGRLFNVMPGPNQMREPAEYVMHLDIVPRKEMELELQKSVLRGEARHAMLLKLEGDRITPLLMAGDGGAVELSPDEFSYKLFHLSRCA